MRPLPLVFASGVLVHGAYDAVRVLVSYKVLNLGGGAAEVGLDRSGAKGGADVF